MSKQNSKQQNNTIDTKEYFKVPFNMKLAKLVSSGSVNGKVEVLHVVSSRLIGAAEYMCYNNTPDGGYKFKINHYPNISFDSVDPLPVSECFFNKEGIGADGTLKLIIKLPEGTAHYQPDKEDKIHDPHYHRLKIEPIEYILANDLGFCEGNVVKYITRYKYKGNPLDDLRKIKEYVDYLIKDLSNKN